MICLVYPFGASEAALLSSRGSIEIIAAEQYLLMKSQITEYDVILYHDFISPTASDILIIMTCLPLVPLPLIQKFEKIIYFFDDLTLDKLNHESAYSERVSELNAIFHPIQLESEKLGKRIDKYAFYVPWSLSRIPENKPQKSEAPSFFVDMDDRVSYADSIPAANAFINVARRIDAQIYVPAKCHPHVLPDLRAFVQPLPLMPHDAFLQFLGEVWFYASGIKGSYEFVVLESAFRGCGLISLFSAVKAEHQSRHFYLSFDGTNASFLTQLEQQLAQYDPSVILTEATALYPADATKQIPILVQRIFQ
jgi:hypothetical protein